MVIWLINHYAVPLNYYPLARQANFAKNLMRMGHEVRIFAASTVHNSDLNLISDEKPYIEIEDNGIKYTLIKCRDYRENGMARIYNMCEFAVKLPKICKMYKKPDAIVATSVPPTSCAMGIHLARKFKCIGVAEIADLWPETLIAYGFIKRYNPIAIGLRMMEKWIYKKADKIVFFEDGDYEYIKEQGWEKQVPRNKVHCISNGVDLDEFKNNKILYQIQDSDLEDESIYKIVYTGAIRKVNNLGLLLDTAKMVCNPRVRFLIWGKGDELESLKKRIDGEKIDNVIFKDAVEKKFIPYITSKANANIVHNSPTKLLRFGISFNKIFDYMAAGKPIICDFSCPFNPAIMANAGIDVEETSPEAIAKAIDEFVLIDQKQYDSYCRNALLAANEYDFVRLTCKLLDVINDKATPIGC